MEEWYQDKFCYKSGDSFSMGASDTQATNVITGIVTNALSSIGFSLDIGKSLENISEITVSELRASVRHNNVYCFGDNIVDMLANISSITVVKVTDFRIGFWISYSSTITNATNNCPVSILVSNMTLQFS